MIKAKKASLSELRHKSREEVMDRRRAAGSSRDLEDQI